ncbi:glycoside hydrolase family 3 C-terminal domain-containing protein [Demequina sp. SYSU T00192]|uniref:Glycoside hydrolase family 3 C-terminal domain-containing protein n=1 Tax=Demequina litoralis TaxID=3051660 RepID=A0ABT8GAX8_9MICO|nr:glycoside hydrolase family 3 C-terminal domain-containing protein [Demequina sp. SYSU T00192]MDN4476122.1 glycoside hydrolase family 3 C-terminal domain-containing protein [Demequina sp. SYSU T00192]
MPDISTLTLEEKARLVFGADFWTTVGIPEKGIPSAMLTDGPHGLRKQTGGSDHLGINGSVPATAFPTAAATGSSWNRELLTRMGAALAAECRVEEVDVLLGPGVNMKRSPLGGRNFEYFSEDPLVAGELGSAWISGLQAMGVGASVKHYAANSQETDRMRVSAEVDERTLREIYLPAFERVVKQSQPATVMCSYNKINGVRASENHWLLTEVLRDEWGYEGYVVSDWGATWDPAVALEAGLDLTMPSTGEAGPAAVVAAVRDGRLDEAVLDRAVQRIVGVHARLRDARTTEATFDADAHHALAREVAADSAVLLANDGDLLPLRSEGGEVAVLGPFATAPRYQGAGSSHVNPTRLDEPLAEIAAGSHRDVVFAPAFRLDGETDEAMLQAAVAAAARAEDVVLMLGLPDAVESEGWDREHMDLPQVQLDVLAAVAAANPRVVVVLSHGSVVSLEHVVGKAPAILDMWLAGQAGGSALAQILFGAAEPGGRLAETVPWRLAHTPAHVNWPGGDKVVRHGERIYIGYRWYDATDRDVAFPFGHGLSYTTFEHEVLAVDVPDPAVAAATVRVLVTNTGARRGTDVVQVYVGDPVAAVDRPVRELRAFDKVALEPGESTVVTLELDDRAFAYWGDGGWTVESGEYVVEVGRSSRDIVAARTLTLDMPAAVPSLDMESLYRDWLAHPAGAAVLAEVVAAGASGQGADLFEDNDMAEMMLQMPMVKIADFVAPGRGAETVRGMLDALERVRA